MIGIEDRRAATHDDDDPRRNQRRFQQAQAAHGQATDGHPAHDDAQSPLPITILFQASHVEAANIPTPRADHNQPNCTGPTWRNSLAYTGKK